MNDLGKADQVIAALHRSGIPLDVSLVYGLPEHTSVSFRESIAWCRDRAVPVLRALPLMLLRGTGLDRDRDRDRRDLVESDDELPLVVRSAILSRTD